MVVECTHSQTVLWASVVAPLLKGTQLWLYAWSNCSVIFSGITPLLQRTQLDFMGVEYIWTVVILSSVLAPLLWGTQFEWWWNIWQDNSKVSFCGTTNFEENSARLDGGGIHAKDNNDVNFNGSTKFVRNSAKHWWWNIHTKKYCKLRW